MSGAILLVTWILSQSQGQSQSYQVQFASVALCEAARGQVFADADRLAKKIQQDYWNAPRAPGVTPLTGPTPPNVSAVCVQG
jgi:hypothetical protein